MTTLVEAFRRQGEACSALGSPLYAALCAAAADDIEHDGAVAGVMSAWDGAGDPMELALPLRLLGTAHRLALLGEAPDLARHLPSCGGRPGPDAAVDLLALVGARADIFSVDLARPVQTNEVGRAAVLRAGLGVVAGDHGMPVRLLEIGAAAGLNLRLDHFAYRLGSVALPGSGPLLEPEWSGPDPPATPLEVLGRAGCDIHPIDVTTVEGAARAESFVWPDMTWRFRRMAAAVEVARQVPAAVERSPAAEWLDRHLRPADGVVTVLMHSVMWQYVPAGEQATIEALVADRAALADEAAPLARLAFEPRFVSPTKWRYVLRAESWPGVGGRRLARAHPHGDRVRWLG